MELSVYDIRVPHTYLTFDYCLGYLYCLDHTSLVIQKMLKFEMIPDIHNKEYEEDLYNLSKKVRQEMQGYM